MSCKFDKDGDHVIAASSKVDNFKIIAVKGYETQHEIRDLGSPAFSLDLTKPCDKVAFGTQNGDVHCLSWRPIDE